MVYPGHGNPFAISPLTFSGLRWRLC